MRYNEIGDLADGFNGFVSLNRHATAWPVRYPPRWYDHDTLYFLRLNGEGSTRLYQIDRASEWKHARPVGALGGNVLIAGRRNWAVSAIPNNRPATTYGEWRGAALPDEITRDFVALDAGLDGTLVFANGADVRVLWHDGEIETLNLPRLLPSSLRVCPGGTLAYAITSNPPGGSQMQLWSRDRGLLPFAALPSSQHTPFLAFDGVDWWAAYSTDLFGTVLHRLDDHSQGYQWPFAWALDVFASGSFAKIALATDKAVSEFLLDLGSDMRPLTPIAGLGLVQEPPPPDQPEPKPEPIRVESVPPSPPSELREQLQVLHESVNALHARLANLEAELSRRLDDVQTDVVLGNRQSYTGRLGVNLVLKPNRTP